MKRPQTQTLIVRIWLEPSVRQPAWRASVTEVHTQKKHYFQDVAELARFLALHMDTPEEHGLQPPLR